MSGISIVIPAYNEEKFLPATLASVNAARDAFENAMHLPTEVVVVNNASTDLTAQTAESLGARVIFHELRNIASVRNAGIKAATHNLIVAIDADCTFPADGLIKIWNCLHDDSLIGVALGVKFISTSWRNKLAAMTVQATVFQLYGLYGAMFAFRKEAALAIGGFPESKMIAEDSIFAATMKSYAAKNGKVFGVLREVEVGTLDRKDLTLKEVLPLLRQVVRAFSGKKQSTEELGFWYKPDR